MKRVLIVDDAMFLRQSLKIMLNNNGYDVIGEAENGASAVKQYEDLRPDKDGDASQQLAGYVENEQCFSMDNYGN